CSTAAYPAEVLWLRFLSRVCVTEKPGVCPRYNVIGICVVSKNNCFNDGECPNDEKCCSYGCGRQCMDPYREKPGVCPRNNVIGICVVSKNNCFNDGECPNDQKCCSYGCGSQSMICVSPMQKCIAVCTPTYCYILYQNCK
uniref:WAP domain-containing protein n=1 Tax=Cyprinus carpio TaxID=7962 RepID=A0A8C1P9B1_CYPCA